MLEAMPAVPSPREATAVEPRLSQLAQPQAPVLLAEYPPAVVNLVLPSSTRFFWPL